jgi:hypothetical protein
MPSPTILGRVVTFPENSKFVTGKGLSRQVINVAAGDITLDACTSGTETKTINWKQSAAGNAFVNCHPLSFVQRTALSAVSAVVNGSALASGNVKFHVRGMVYTDLAVPDPLQMADVTYSYKRERYDLIHLGAGGDIAVTKGQEVDFAASEFLPAAPSGRFPLFYAYVWNDTVELVDAHSWDVNTPKNPIQKARVASLRARNFALLPNLRAALASGNAVIAGYGDSITSVGGGWAATGGEDDTTYLASQAGGAARDTASFLYWHDPALRAKYPELGSTFPQVGAGQVSWGEGKKIAAALGATWKNWGIGGTNTGTGNTASGAPNGGNPTRLNNFNADTFHAVILDFMMNDFVGFASGGLEQAMTTLVQSIKAAHPNSDIIIRSTKGINTENAQGGNDIIWLQRAEEAYRRVAFAEGCAFIPTQMVTHGDPGFLKISRQHYSGGNRYNHQTPYELAKMAEWELAVLGF